MGFFKKIGEKLDELAEDAVQKASELKKDIKVIHEKVKDDGKYIFTDPSLKKLGAITKDEVIEFLIDAGELEKVETDGNN